MIHFPLLLLLSLVGCDGYKFLVYSPIFGYSHTNFMGAIADTLTEAGHDVTLLMPIMDTEQEKKTGVKLTKKIVKVPGDPRVIEMMRYEGEILKQIWTMEPSIFALMQIATNMTKSFTFQCEKVFSDEALMKQLEDEKFDVGIAEAFSICGLGEYPSQGIFDLIKIPASIVTFSGVHMEAIAAAIGEPIAPSYVPGAIAREGDRMSFVGRVKNVIDVVLDRKFFTNIFESEISAFRRRFGPQFKGYEELFVDASYVVTNSNPYLDYPRPMLHKTVPIGGIAVSIDPKKNKLSAEWDALLNERNTTVLVSFGSIAKSIYMPHKYMYANGVEEYPP
ncbi:hypothetical protein Y032_0002g957 [Ancylostoma ceylanicum]|uniref:glucuronosyltransferase n=1 Tax=Ancylostoma ceylanicum TaxID=53326 RepID=A0A016W364_9BILA|nr:hypothetical protein Y032_0002g957 [Ancylostoma ceylanicum]